MRRISLLFAVLVCGIFVTQAFGTAQAPDKIWYEGKLYDMQTNPMEPYFAKNPGKRPKTNLMLSSLSRGYIATFELVDGGLFLRDFEVLTLEPPNGPLDSMRSGMRSVIGEIIPTGQKMKIDWFDGLLVLPHGKLVNYVHMGYGSTFEIYILLEIAAGDLKRAKSFDHKQYEAFKDRQFAEFKKTEEYRKLLKQMKADDENWDQRRMDAFIRSFVTNYSAKILVD